MWPLSGRRDLVVIWRIESRGLLLCREIVLGLIVEVLPHAPFPRQSCLHHEGVLPLEFSDLSNPHYSRRSDTFTPLSPPQR